MPEFIIQTRVIPRKSAGNIVNRTRLTKLLADNSEKNLVLICCPAGYGKTTLVQEYLIRFEKRTAWYQATEDISNFYTFVSYLVYSLKALKAEFGNSVLEVIESSKESMNISKDLKTIVSTVMGTFVNEFVQSFDEETILVIDDLHNLGKPDWLNSAFESLLENFPENLRMIITTRQHPEFDVSRFRAKRKLLELDKEDLIFNNEEIIQVLEKIYSLKYSSDELNLLEDKLKGWITGIHLIIQAYGKDINKAKLESSVIPETIFQFFANDIFNNLNEEVQDFLLNSSLLDSFTPEICDNLFQMTKSNEIIRLLQDRNIFIESSQIADNEQDKLLTLFNYHSLFRDYLQTKQKETKTEEHIHDLYRKISSYYRNNNDVVSSIKYSLASGDFEAMIPLLVSSYNPLTEEGRYETLWNWVSRIPESYLSRDIRLLYFKGTLAKNHEGDMEKAGKYLDEVLANESSKDDELLLIDTTIQKAEVLKLLGKAQEALKCLKDLEGKEISDNNRVKLSHSIANILYRIGPQKYDEIIKILDETIGLSDTSGMKNVQIELYNLYGNIFQDRGEFIKSLFYYESVLKNVTNIFTRFLTITNIILLKAYTGNFNDAYKYLEDARSMYRKFPSKIFERNLLRITALFKFESGDYEDAIVNFESLNEIDLKSNIRFYNFWYYELIGESYYLLNKPDKAKQFYELAYKHIDEGDEYQKIEYDVHNAILQKQFSVEPSIEKTLLKTLTYFESQKYLHSRVQIEFHLADYYFKKGQPQTSLSYLSSVLGISKEKQYLSALEQSFIEKRYLFDFAIANNVEKDFISNIHNGVEERLSFSWLSEGCRNRISKDSESLFDISLRTFGGVEITVRGNPVPESKWARKKSKQMLVYLLMNPYSRFTKDKIMDLFFQDAAAGSVENLFHQVISNIRTALEVTYDIKINSGEENAKLTKAKKTQKSSGETGNANLDVSPSFLIYEDKTLNLDPVRSYKVDALEFDKLFNRFKSAESGEENKISAAKKAIGLYPGEFMSGYYESWCEELRETYIGKMIDLCEFMIAAFKRRGQYYKVIQYCDILLTLDKLHEEAYLEIMQAYTNIGNLSMARKKFSTMLKTYESDYGEKPPKPVLDKIQKILFQ